MATEQSVGQDAGTGDDEESYAVLLAKCLGVGIVMGIVGLGVFLGLMFGADITWSGIGLLPAVLAGYGVRRVAGERGGYLTGGVALLTGQGPVLVMYLLLLGVGLSLGRGDVVIILFGIYASFKLGMGTEGAGETLADAAAEEGGDPQDVAQADVDLPEGEEGTAASDAERAVGAPADGGTKTDGELTTGGGDDDAAGGGDDGDTASDFVETGFDEDDF